MNTQIAVASTLPERHAAYEREGVVHGSAKLAFRGVDGFDVYNPSIPFEHGGRTWIFGRVERRTEWARSWVRLFEKTGQDEWTLVPDSMIWQLEDPYVQTLGDEIVMGGTHVRMNHGVIDTYYGYFYRGRDLSDLRYFLTGPDYMKDIRLVPLADGGVGVFSRPRSEAVRAKYGSESVIGYLRVDRLEDLSPEKIANAPVLPDLFGKDEWGGCNQAYALRNGRIGVIGHQCYRIPIPGKEATQVYLNVAFVFDPATHRAGEIRIIGSRSRYPAGPAKKPNLVDCAFTSGIVRRADGKVDLYSGLGDAEAGRLVIDDPFAGEWPRPAS